jgi:hypothetical protein
MRTYGRTRDLLGKPTWHVVTTDANGFDDMVWVTTLIQTLKLNLGESPFYANYGIPAHSSVMQQIFPDYYIAYTQQQYSQYFASLIVARLPTTTPQYQVQVVTHQGVQLNVSVPIPE